MNKIIVIVGPTASGKTDFAIDIAKKINSEIVSADSLQVYREFNICTSKPTIKQMKEIKHHLIGHISVSEEYNVFSFIKDAEKCISKISKKGIVPIVVGGTGLYIDALVKNFQLREDKKTNFSENIKDLELHQVLESIDPLAAKQIHKNDFKRIRNAINFFKEFNCSILTQEKNTSFISSKFEVLKFGLSFKDRQKLYDKINLRVDKMLDYGLINEIDFVRKLNVSKTASAAIGYKELLPFFENKCSLNESLEKIKQQTRRYAKRQITWFKRCDITNWIFMDEKNKLDDILEFIKDKKFDVQ